MAAWIPLVGAGISALGSLVGSWFGKKSTDNSNKANLELAKYQAQQNQLMLDRAYNQNLHMWNETNAYNSPVAQMARLKTAGLNPNLVYGTGTVTGNTSGSAPQLEAASYDAPNIRPYTGWNLGLTDAVSTYMQARSNQAQVTSLETQTDYVRQQTINEAAKTAGIAASSAKSQFDYDLAKDLRQEAVESARANLMKLQGEAHGAMTEANIKSFIHRELQPLQKKYSESQIKQIEVSTSKLLQDMDFDKFNYDLMRKGINLRDVSGLLRDILGPLIIGGVRGVFNPR